jgi:plastocyanin
MRNLTFSCSPVKAGAKVTIQNHDTVEHTVTADAGGFDVTVNADGTASFTAPSKAGSYKFHCKIHASMHGTLVVT